MIRASRAVWVLLAGCLLSASGTHAAEGGYSNYVPGTYGDFALAVEPESRLTIRNDVYYYGADGDRSMRSGLLELDSDLNSIMNFTTLLYKPELRLLGAGYAFGLFVPIVHMDIDSTVDLGDRTLTSGDDETNIGDITLIPLALFWKHGDFHFSCSHSIVMPTGKYDVDDLANTGLNYWSFDTNVASTYLNPASGTEVSFNLGYMYNTENDDTDYQTGQDLHLDFVLNQFLSETFAVGVHGFYLNQITGDSGDGAALGDFKAEAIGLGPALLWSTLIAGKGVSFIGKWLHEFDADNRLEGDHVFASVALGF